MDYKIVFSDLDGTFLDSSARVSEENAKAIALMKEKGVMFVPTTGRALSEIPAEVVDNPNVRYIITSNGSAVYDKDESNFYFNTIEKENIDLLLSFVKDSTVMICVHYNGVSYYSRADMDNHQYFRMNEYYYTELIKCVDFIDTDMRSFVSSLPNVCCFCIFFRYDSELKKCVELLKECGKFNFTSSVKHQLEICSKGVNKGEAVRAFCRQQGVSTENTISLGDSKNDIELLKSTGLSLAVKNATAELVPYADKVICSNNEHTADYVLKNYILK